MKPQNREKVLNAAFDCGAVPISVDPATGKITAVGFMVEDVARLLNWVTKRTILDAAQLLEDGANVPELQESKAGQQSRDTLRGAAASFRIIAGKYP